MRRSHTFFEKYWQNMMEQRIIRVPQGCPTVEKAMALAVVFSERKVYTETDPLKIQLDQGVHEIVGYADEYDIHYKRVNVTCSHITFVGKGKNETTVRGMFVVRNQQNVKFEELAVTNDRAVAAAVVGPTEASDVSTQWPNNWQAVARGDVSVAEVWKIEEAMLRESLMNQMLQNTYGLLLEGSETNVDVLKCILKECTSAGMCARDGATVIATHCEFTENGGDGLLCQNANTKVRLDDCKVHHNGGDGLNAHDQAVVDLHGTKTDIHSNKRFGLGANWRVKVNIHLPSQHNTTHDNDGEDRHQYLGGSIANVNADGTFTHVVVDEDEDDD